MEHRSQRPPAVDYRHQRILRLARHMFVLGLLTLWVPVLVAAAFFTGGDGGHFNPLNVSLSELGSYGYSRLAVLANGGLFFGGLVLALSCLQGARVLERSAIWIMLACCWLLLSFSGLFPSNVYHLHSLALQWFFYSSLATCLGYLFWSVLKRDAGLRHMPLAMALLTLLSVTSFLLMPYVLSQDMGVVRHFYAEVVYADAGSWFLRPRFWWPGLLLWLSLTGLVLWHGLMLRDGE